jgi:organic radical activating enzyme
MADAARAIEALEAAARKLSVRIRFDPGSLIPPCVFAQPLRIAHMFSLTQGGSMRPNYVQLAGCARCVVRDRCPGVPQAMWSRNPAMEVHPIEDDRARRRLSMVSTVDEQIARELVTRDVRRMKDGSTLRENIVRINFHCNQACTFCFVSTHLPPASNEAIEAAIVEIAREGGVLTISGGEPTLNPRLAEYVGMGKRLGAKEVELQTNAMRLGDPELTRSLVEAGLDVAFVSLHASNAILSDFVTQAPGTFEKTVAGLDELAKTSVIVRLNFVFCEANHADFPDYIAMVAERWPKATVTVSFVAASTDVVPKDRAMIPRYTDVMPHLSRGVRMARNLGILVTGFESMCGIPLCQVPDDLSEFFALPEIVPGMDRGEFRKTEVCAACALDRRCFGIRRGYADMHGVDELVPVPEAAR